MNPEVLLEITALIGLIVSVALTLIQLAWAAGCSYTLKVAEDCSMEEWWDLAYLVELNWFAAFVGFMLTVPPFFKWYLA